jgi:hypothetical protein
MWQLTDLIDRLWGKPRSRNADVLARLELMEHRIMSAFTDLQAAAARIAASASAEIKAVSAKIDALSAGNVTDQQLSDLSAQLNAAADALDTETATLAPPAPPADVPPTA